MIGLSLLLGITGGGTPTPTPTPTPTLYLPAVASPPSIAYGAKRIVSGYNGNLFTLRKTTGGTTQSFGCAAGSDLPDYAAISTWAAGSALSVAAWFDQSGNAKDLTNATVTQQPTFDLTLALAGCVPVMFDGEINSTLRFRILTASGVSLSSQNMTVMHAVQSYSSIRSHVYWEADDGTNPVANQFLGGAAPLGLRSMNGTTPRNTTAATAPRLNPSVIGFTGSTTETRHYARESSVSGPAHAATTGVNFVMGYTKMANASFFAGRYRSWGIAVYPALSDADAVMVRNALASMFAIPTNFTSRVVFDGDSITEGYPSVGMKSMPLQLGLPSTVELFNVAIFGQYLSQAYSNRADRSIPLFTSAYGAGKCILALGSGGVNDININAATDTALSTTYSNYVLAMKTAGYKVGGVTLLPVTAASWDGTKEGYRIAYNNAVRANGAGADFVVDVANDAVMGPLTAPDDTTLYFDKLHPTGTGYLREATAQFAPALTAAGAA